MVENNEHISNSNNTEEKVVTLFTRRIDSEPEQKAEHKPEARPEPAKSPVNPVAHFLHGFKNILKLKGGPNTTPPQKNYQKSSPATKVSLIKPDKIEIIRPKKTAQLPLGSQEVSKKVEAASGYIPFNNLYFETLLMVIIIMWLLKWLFGFNSFVYNY